MKADVRLSRSRVASARPMSCSRRFGLLPATDVSDEEADQHVGGLSPQWLTVEA